jgi:hypothetical protein
MSVITNIILITASGEQPACTDQLNFLLGKIQGFDEIEAIHWPLLRRVDDEASGRRTMECRVYLGAINALQEEEFLEAWRSVQWKFPESVQLLLKRHEERQFTSVAL